jgi:hypothetical protein
LIEKHTVPHTYYLVDTGDGLSFFSNLTIFTGPLVDSTQQQRLHMWIWGGGRERRGEGCVVSQWMWWGGGVEEGREEGGIEKVGRGREGW